MDSTTVASCKEYCCYVMFFVCSVVRCSLLFDLVLVTYCTDDQFLLLVYSWTCTVSKLWYRLSLLVFSLLLSFLDFSLISNLKLGGGEAGVIIWGEGGFIIIMIDYYDDSIHSNQIIHDWIFLNDIASKKWAWLKIIFNSCFIIWFYSRSILN